jgi:hypothetical protein
LFRIAALSHACKTPLIEGGGASDLPVPFPGSAKKKEKKRRRNQTNEYPQEMLLEFIDICFYLFFISKNFLQEKAVDF